MELPDEWTILSERPLEDRADYLELIANEHVDVIIVDERLNEAPESRGISYSGHELASFLRGFVPDFPIFSITAYAGTDDLEEQQSALDGVIARDAFTKQPELYVPRFQRAAQKWHITNRDAMRRLTELAARRARGEPMTVAEQGELEGLRARLEHRRATEVEPARADVLDRLEPLLLQAKSLQAEIIDRIAKGQSELSGTAPRSADKDNDKRRRSKSKKGRGGTFK
ncbi:MAG: hypothetical protein IPG45_13200 [Deltaproteobacteria bacterium]|nr:hypothetical protein [Deltaproteobacteria bacterium]